MPQISKYALSRSVEDEIFKSFGWLISRLDREDHVDRFLSDFLTKTEKMMLAKRLALALMVEKGYHYFVIRDTLKVSTSTIRGMKSWLENRGEGYRLAIRKLAEKDRLDVFWKEVGKFVEIVAKGRRVFPKSK